MKTLIATVLLLLGLSTPAWATTYYIDDAGSDAAAGTSTSVPWKTWARAFVTGSPKMACGDTLIVMDGTYTSATHGQLLIAGYRCQVGNPMLVQAQNQRVPLLQSDGAPSSGESIKITDSAYVTIDGLRVKSVDNAAGAGLSWAMILVAGYNGGLTLPSDHITLKNLILSHNNRYVNQSLIRVAATTNSLLEDIELYSYHRHGALFSANTSNNVMRRIYCNSRGYPDLSELLVPKPFESGYDSRGDSCVAQYTAGGATVNSDSNVFENIISEGQGAGFDIEAVFGPSNDKFYGDISFNDTFGILLKSRGETLITQQPLNTVVTDFVVVTPSGPGIYLRGNRNTQVTNATVYGSTANSGWFSDVEGLNDGSGTVSVFGTNILSTANAQRGFNISEQTTWTITNGNSFGNVSANSPASSANYVSPSPPSTTDPEMGTCRVWRPDASAAKASDWGADILYRYEYGILTETPLWDPTTGEFPHGAIIAGVNDIAGSSLFDVHERLNINTGGCDFPATYAGGTPPVDPADNYIPGTGTTTASAQIVIPAGTDFLFVPIGLRASTGGVGNVATVTSSCGSESLAQVTNATAVDAGTYYRTSIWYKAAPTAGTCTITVTTSGTVTLTNMVAVIQEGFSALGDVAVATGLSTTPSVTVPTNTSEVLLSVIAGRCNYDGVSACTTTFTAGANETLQRDDPNPVLNPDMRLVVSTQAGDDGGVLSGTFGATTYWAQVGLALEPTVPDPPVTPCTLTQVAGQVDSAFLVNDAVVHLGAVNAANVAVDAGISFAVTLQTDATAEACATMGRKLYVSYDGGAYAAVGDTMTNGLSFFGATADPLVVSGAISTNLSGVLTNVPGTTIHSASVNPMATMTEDDSLVNRWVLKLDPTAVDTHTFEFREYTDAGVALNAYGATADAKITVTGTAPVISAPANLTLVGPSSNTIVELIWAPSTYATFAGYRIYRGTATGVYGASPIATITPTSAAARHTPQTRYLDLTHVAGTYYYVVTAFDLDNNESPVSNEVSITMTGFTARGAP